MDRSSVSTKSPLPRQVHWLFQTHTADLKAYEIQLVLSSKFSALRSANVYVCNFAIYRNEYSKQYPDAKAMRETTEHSGYNASNEITRVKLGGAHGLT